MHKHENGAARRFTILTICMTLILCITILALLIAARSNISNQNVLAGQIVGVAVLGVGNIFILLRQETNRTASQARSEEVKHKVEEIVEAVKPITETMMPKNRQELEDVMSHAIRRALDHYERNQLQKEKGREDLRRRGLSASGDSPPV